MEKFEKNGSEGQVIRKHIGLEVTCAIIKEKQNELTRGQKHGEATQVTEAGRKTSIGIGNEIEDAVEDAINEFIRVGVQKHECQFDPETGLAVRIINGQVVKVDPKLMSAISKERKRTGKSIKEVKVKNTKSKNKEADERN